MRIGEAIRIARTRRGIRQGELAKRAGVSQSLVSMIENGHRDPTTELVERLCQAMEVPIQLVLLLACEPDEGREEYRPALEKLGLAMIELLAALK